MLTVSSSRASGKGDPTFVVALLVSAIRTPGDREIDGLRAKGLGPAQWEALPAVRQHDARQVRVSVELNAEEIEQLSFVPVRAGNDRRNAWRLAVRACFEPQ